VQRKCACGGTAGASGECEECRQKKAQRKTTVPEVAVQAGAIAPPLVHEVLRSSGQPLDRATRLFMEPRLGHDFSQVRVHADAKAAESASAVQALAYTVGRNVVFDRAQYAPHTQAGKRLLAHELAHVVQQGTAPSPATVDLRVGAAHDLSETEAERAAERVMSRGGGVRPILRIGPSLQRSCGPEAIGKPKGCVLLQGDVPGERFLFQVNCDEFRGPPETLVEESRLADFAKTLASGDTIEIHGFASDEGDAAFNLNLSCARALAAMAVIQPIAPPISIQLFAHGATPGEAASERSVVIVRNPAPPVIAPVPPVDPPVGQHICGPDIFDAVAAVLADVRTTFGGWPSAKKRGACDAITNLNPFGSTSGFVMAWDIENLFLPNTAWLRSAPFHPPCGMPGAAGDVEDSKTCSNSVEVHNKCFLAGTVNYVLFGQICKLCNAEFGVLSESTMENLITLWKALGWIALDFDDPGPPTAWARAGFHGFPGFIPTVENRAHCKGRCPATDPVPSFTWVWEPHHPR
jgi:hypothetical protein